MINLNKKRRVKLQDKYSQPGKGKIDKNNKTATSFHSENLGVKMENKPIVNK
jgi:hypothetical protein